MEKKGKKYIALFSLKTKKVNIYGFEMITEGVKYHPLFVIAVFSVDSYLLDDE